MLVAFVPVLHKGYLQFFAPYSGDVLCILGSDVIANYTSLTRDCRTINPGIMKHAIDALNIFREIRIITKADLAALPKDTTIVMPDEDVSRALVQAYSLTNVTYESIFLRWDFVPTLRVNDVTPNEIVLRDAFSKSMMSKALTEAARSSDWWRQIGAAIVKDGAILTLTHNTHLPTDFHLGTDGDPRTNFNAGEHIEFSTAIHAEARAIAQCAKSGNALAGAEIFVTTFPCPNCAKLVAESGISRVYYAVGYSLLDAKTIFDAYGIDIIRVELSDTSN